jgi:hypothetical protein
MPAFQDTHCGGGEAGATGIDPKGSGHSSDHTKPNRNKSQEMNVQCSKVVEAE